MAERARERTREREPRPDRSDAAGWKANRRHEAIQRDRSENGKIVIHADDRQWEIGPMGRMYRYLNEGLYDDAAIMNWWVFANDIRVHGGRHRHQGGLVIYVVEGRGYSIVDGVREEWEAGDVLLLPIKPGGAEHQHFNSDPSQPAKWVAFIYVPFRDAMGGEAKVLEDSPQWLAAGRKSVVGTAQNGEDTP